MTTLKMYLSKILIPLPPVLKTTFRGSKLSEMLAACDFAAFPCA